MAENDLRVRKIRNGTVIDHISPGWALAVLRILKIPRSGYDDVLSVILNVTSKTHERKDIVKIEGRELNPTEVDQVALIAPRATINIIRNFSVADKKRVRLPTSIREVLRCPNPTCVTNNGEPVKSHFTVESSDPLTLECYYCGQVMEKEDVAKQF